MITLLLPKPPSVNELYKRGRKGQVFRSKRYEAWRDEAGWHLISHYPADRVEGPYTVNLTLSSDNRRGDCDGRLKATLDFLVSMRVTPDDRFCERATAEWDDKNELGKGMCRVVITPVSQSRAA